MDPSAPAVDEQRRQARKIRLKWSHERIARVTASEILLGNPEQSWRSGREVYISLSQMSFAAASQIDPR
jgi:hypothetical protein